MEAQVSVVGLDIAKSVFQVHAADSVGKAVIRRRLKREEVEAFFRKLPPSLVALEGCPGSHFWARLLRDIGHDVRLLPAQYVRPYVKTNKSDAADQKRFVRQSRDQRCASCRSRKRCNRKFSSFIASGRC